LGRRYKRFLADVSLDTGENVTAHCPNSGSMLSVAIPESQVWLSKASNPKRKLRYTWELVRLGSAMVGINTNHPNAIAAEAVAEAGIPELTGYATIRREVKYGRNSRIDLLLEAPDRPKCLVEVKNVTLRRELETGSPLEFPDAVTARGTKHLEELANAHSQGARAVMLFLAQRNDSGEFTIAADIDPVYAETLKQVMVAGVEVVCYSCHVSTDEITVESPLRLLL
jgi:sugar fermentation stimulation protein A